VAHAWTTGLLESDDVLRDLPKKELRKLDEYGYDKYRYLLCPDPFSRALSVILYALVSGVSVDCTS
jgi:hypothetical protein